MNRSFTSVTLSIALFGALVFVACRKDNNSGNTTPPPTGDTTSVARTDEDSLKYLMYRIMQVTYEDGGRDTRSTLPTYYWYSNVPALNPLSSSYAKAEDLLEVMKGYAKGGTSASLDRYSFLDRTGSLSSALEDGVSEKINNPRLSATGTYGMEVTFAMDGSYKTHLEILYADKNSPAGLKGLTRGDEITAINGDTALSYYKSSNIDKIVDAIYNSSTVTLTVTKFNGAKSDYTINAGTFNINPVLFDTTYTVNGSKVGYFVFYTYTSTINSKGAYTNTKNILDALFTKFKGEGVTNMIVDLRYNGGGSVATAEYLDSVLAPASAANKTMYYYKYNDKLSALGSSIGLDASVNFPANTGGFALNNIFFITSRNTASASELTLNNLKPYMSGKLFTVGDTSYGKPVGFISFTINKYDSTHKEKYMADLYAINFATENANHVGGYYTGIPADKLAYDYVDLPWGHTSDANLKSIFYYITNGSFPAAPTGARVASSSEGNNNRAAITNSIASPRFNGMVDYRTGKRAK
jgi:carboxyl-terminal processing protease